MRKGVYPLWIYGWLGKIQWNFKKEALKKTKVKLDLLTEMDMLLMVGKGIRRGLCHSIYWYANSKWKANNKCMNTWKIMINIKNRHIFNIET